MELAVFLGKIDHSNTAAKDVRKNKTKCYSLVFSVPFPVLILDFIPSLHTGLGMRLWVPK